DGGILQQRLHAARAVERHHHDVEIPYAAEEQLSAIWRRPGRRGARTEPLSPTSLVDWLPEHPPTLTRREVGQMTAVCPHRSKVRRGIERQAVERAACEIPHPEVELLILDGDRQSRPVRRQARMDVGARGRTQRLLA